VTKNRIAGIISLLVCVTFAVSLVGATLNYSTVLSQKDSEIEALTSQVDELEDKIASDNNTINRLNGQIADLQNQITSANNQITSLTSQVVTLENQLENSNAQISSLNSRVASLQNQVNDLKAIIGNPSISSDLETLVFHVCEKGEGYVWGRLPDVNYTYNQLLSLNKGKYDVLLLPEYRGNQNWNETFAWLVNNFSRIPIALSVFEGGSNPTPNMMLTISQISEAVATLNVRELRIGEIISWHMERLLPFPTDYITNLLNFARSHNLRVQWSEWKVNDNVFQRIQNYTAGFEDILTVTFQTNSKEMEPADGFLLVSKLFQRWGGSIQSWYWQERGYGSEFDMPASLLVQHTLAAKNIGADILQFEPYWYFFDNGEPKETLRTLMAALT
jgi:uncharacterized coiled-coil protein SlyX